MLCFVQRTCPRVVRFGVWNQSEMTQYILKLCTSYFGRPSRLSVGLRRVWTYMFYIVALRQYAVLCAIRQYAYFKVSRFGVTQFIQFTRFTQLTQFTQFTQFMFIIYFLVRYCCFPITCHCFLNQLMTTSFNWMLAGGSFVLRRTHF